MPNLTNSNRGLFEGLLTVFLHMEENATGRPRGKKKE